MHTQATIAGYSFFTVHNLCLFFLIREFGRNAPEDLTRLLIFSTIPYRFCFTPFFYPPENSNLLNLENYVVPTNENEYKLQMRIEMIMRIEMRMNINYSYKKNTKKDLTGVSKELYNALPLLTYLPFFTPQRIVIY